MISSGKRRVIACALVAAVALPFSLRLHHQAAVRNFQERILLEAPAFTQDRAHRLALLGKKYGLSPKQMVIISSIAKDAQECFWQTGFPVTIDEQKVIDRLLRNRLLFLNAVRETAFYINFELLMRRARMACMNDYELFKLRKELDISMSICVFFKRALDGLPEGEAAQFVLFLGSNFPEVPEGYYLSGVRGL